MIRLLVLSLLLVLPLPAHASFYYICTLKVKVERFTVSNTDAELPDVEADFTILNSSLESGHIEDPNCHFEKGQFISISTLPTDEERETFAKQSRKLEKFFKPGDYSLDEIKPGDVLTLRYNFNNRRLGDRHQWELKRVNGLLDKLRY